MNDLALKKKFEQFLINRGYKLQTSSGKKSTVYDYLTRIDFVCGFEKLSWYELAKDIDSILVDYLPDGTKSELGAKSNNAVRSAMKQYKIFARQEYISRSIIQRGSKNKISNEFLKRELTRLNIKFRALRNSFYEITILDDKVFLKCRTYDNNYTFIQKSEIPELSPDIIIALVEWRKGQPANLYLIPMLEWNNPNITFLKDRVYDGLDSDPEWGIDINRGNKHELSRFNVEQIIEAYKEDKSKKLIEGIENNIINSTEKQALIKTRVGQTTLKNKKLSQKGKCEICGLSHNKLLIASHIKPWSKSDDFEKLDCENILLLCPMHDALFDKGLITFDDAGKILISSELDSKTQALVNINENAQIDIVSDKQKEYLDWHRENLFIK